MLIRVIPLLFVLLQLESCANSIQILPARVGITRGAQALDSGTAYVSVDMSGIQGISHNEAQTLGNQLGASLAEALDSTFWQSRAVPDLTRLEPGPDDLVILVRTGDLKRPKLWGELSRGWLRVLVVGLLAEIYNIVSLDSPRYRNNVVLPFAAVSFSLYELLYCYQYEETEGDFTLAYQISLLRPDGSLMNRHQFVDSAKALVQADARIREFPTGDFVKITTGGVAGSIRNHVIADSVAIKGLAREMTRAYPTECDRILAFKRNVYRVLDDTTSRTD